MIPTDAEAQELLRLSNDAQQARKAARESWALADQKTEEAENYSRWLMAKVDYDDSGGAS